MYIFPGEILELEKENTFLPFRLCWLNFSLTLNYTLIQPIIRSIH